MMPSGSRGRAADALAPLSIVLILVGSLLGVLVVGAGILFAIDAPLDATVTGTRCALLSPGADSAVTVQTKVLGITHTVKHVDDDVCRLVENGDFVRYHVRSGRTILYDHEGGPCLWDTARGPTGGPCA